MSRSRAALTGLCLLLLVTSVGCPGEIGVADSCAPTTLQVCICPDRTPSSALCQSDGTFGPCECGGEADSGPDQDADFQDLRADSEGDGSVGDMGTDSRVDLADADEIGDSVEDAGTDSPADLADRDVVADPPTDRAGVDGDHVESDAARDGGEGFAAPSFDSETYTVACGGVLELNGTFSAMRPATQLVIRLLTASLPVNVPPLEGTQLFDDPVAGVQPFTVEIAVPDWMPGSEWRTNAFEMWDSGGSLQGNGATAGISMVTITCSDPDLDPPARPELSSWQPQAPATAGCTDRIFAEYEVFDERSGVTFGRVTFADETLSLESNFAPANLEGELRRVSADLHYNLPTGEYQAEELTLMDGAGNAASWTSSDVLFELLVECDEYDVVPPTLLALEPPVPSRVRPGVLFTVVGEASDADGEVAVAQLEYGPETGSGIAFNCELGPSTRLTCRGSVEIGATVGEWSLNAVYLKDSHGNEVWLNEGDDGFPANVAELGFEVLP